MSQNKTWWSNWSLYWEDMENQYLGLDAINKLLNDIVSPVLLIGAGQGLIYKFLVDKGFTVEGIDNEENMIHFAKKRHSINIIKAEASNLPFEDNYFNTVIISSGVIDYINNNNTINDILHEALRVTSIHGNLFIAFYQILSKLEKFYKKIGIIQSDKFYMKRIFHIRDIADKNPLNCIFPIMEWTKKNFLYVLLYWSFVGFNIPKELIKERNKIDNIFDKAKNDNYNVDLLINAIPEVIPYRDENLITNLILNLGFIYNGIDRFNDCVILRIFKSAFLTYKLKELKENRSDKSIKNNDKNKNYIIKIENLMMKYKTSKVNALNSLNLKIKKGEIFGLLGPNGAGKTTTLSIISGLIKQTSGTVKFLNLPDKNSIKQKLGVVPQDVSLYSRLTAKENLIFFGNLYKISRDKLNKRINEILYLVGLQDRANEIVTNFSIGMKRRLNFAIGLINDPEIILMDEPTVGIDPQSRNKIYQLVLDLRNKGTTIIYTTHYIEEANKLCDYVSIMDHGKIIVSGKPQDIVKKYCFINFIYHIGKKLNDAVIKQLKKIKSIIDISIRNNELHVISSGLIDKVILIDQINTIVKKSKTKLSLIKIIEPSLESLFLDITGKNLRDLSD